MHSIARLRRGLAGAAVLVTTGIVMAAPADAANIDMMTFPGDGTLRVVVTTTPADTYEPHRIRYTGASDSTIICPATGHCAAQEWTTPAERAGSPFDLFLSEGDGGASLSDDAKFSAVRNGTGEWTFTRLANSFHLAYNVRLVFQPGVPTPTTPPNRPPRFFDYPTETVYPRKGVEGFSIAAQDADGDPVTITWSALPRQPVEVTCDNLANPAAVASVLCHLTPTSGTDRETAITFTATDPKGATATRVVKVGPSYYLGMGDSYASGEGNPPFDLGTATPSNFPWNDVAHSCHRSSLSWQQLLDLDIPYARQGHFACSGADTVKMRADFKDETGQIEHLAEQSPKPNLIVLTVGGNDVGFGSVVGACYLGGQKPLYIHGRRVGGEEPCRAAVAVANYKIARELRSRLITTYDAIHAAAPDAKIVVVGYPNIISTARTSSASCPWASAGTLRSLSKIATTLDSATRSAVQAVATRDNVAYLSVLDALKDHELCTPNSDTWVNGIRIGPREIRNGTYAYSAHPNDRGQQAIRRRVAAYVTSQ